MSFVQLRSVMKSLAVTDRISSVITIHSVNAVAVNCKLLVDDWCRPSSNRSFRLCKGAFAQASSSAAGSSSTTDPSANPISSSAKADESPSNPNTLVSTRLRQTDKRLRKIHSVNNVKQTPEKSKTRMTISTFQFLRRKIFRAKELPDRSQTVLGDFSEQKRSIHFSTGRNPTDTHGQYWLLSLAHVTKLRFREQQI